MAPTNTPKKAAAGLSGGAIAGIVIGVLAGVALLAAGIWYYTKNMAGGQGQSRPLATFERMQDDDDDVAM
jgi:hypothetical protein